MKRIKEDNQKAVALTYKDSEDNAPIVKAKGKGKVAENIILTAKKNNIPIQEDSSLVELLSQLKINEAIPEELFQAVAEIFAFIYKADKSL